MYYYRLLPLEPEFRMLERGIKAAPGPTNVVSNARYEIVLDGVAAASLQIDAICTTTTGDYYGSAVPGYFD